MHSPSGGEGGLHGMFCEHVCLWCALAVKVTEYTPVDACVAAEIEVRCLSLLFATLCLRQSLSVIV